MTNQAIAGEYRGKLIFGLNQQGNTCLSEIVFRGQCFGLYHVILALQFDIDLLRLLRTPSPHDGSAL